MKDINQIKEPLLRELIQLRVPVQVIAVGGQKGFALHFRFGTSDKTLATSRGGLRLFASLDTAGNFIRDVGITNFEVDMAAHQPGRLRRPRPDRAAALRLTRTRLRQQPLEFQHGEATSL